MAVVTFHEFTRSATDAQPPASLTPPLLALWQDAKGDWESAHQTAQAIDDQSGAWIHAYLHRKEGDASNAAYWYRRAGKPVCGTSLEAEWEEIVSALLGA